MYCTTFWLYLLEREGFCVSALFPGIYFISTSFAIQNNVDLKMFYQPEGYLKMSVVASKMDALLFYSQF